MKIITSDKPYKPLAQYVLDPLQYTAMGIAMRRKMDGEARWDRCVEERRKHPDWRKIACVAHGAIIYLALYPEKKAPEMIPPAEWLIDAGINEATLAQAREIALEAGKDYDLRKRVVREMDGIYG